MESTIILIGVKDNVEKDIENRISKSICFKIVLDCIDIWTMFGGSTGCADCKIMGK